MGDMFNKLALYFSYDFVIYALIVGVLIALCSSLLGVSLVLKRSSYLSDGLSHVAFGALAVASVMNLTNENMLVLPVTVIAAIFLLFSRGNAKVHGDAKLAMASVSAMAIGYFLLNVFSTSTNLAGDICSTLFGSTSLLTLNSSDVLMCILLSIFVIGFYIIFYNKIFAVTFDETFTKSTGVKVNLYNIGIAVVIAIVIVISMTLVGSLLISALVIFPALCSMRLFNNFKNVVIFSSIIGVSCAFFGMIISLLIDTPVGSTIVIANLFCYIICNVIAKIMKI